jgi:uncharacterized protein (DUF1499 family)
VSSVPVTHERAWWSQAVLIGALVAAVMLPMGALGSRLGIWGFQTGFLFLAGGALLAVIALVGGIVGAIVALRQRRHADRAPVLIGAVICAAILAFLAGQFMTARSVPPIHNISTDVDDPPEFDVVVGLRGADSNPLAFDRAKLAAAQQAAYPFVAPLDLAEAPDAAFDRALDVLTQLGLEVVNADREAGRIEAVATTFWFGFKDDVVVRIRPTDSGGSRVDVRSVSRVGQSDLGANAARIGRILAGIRGEPRA